MYHRARLITQYGHQPANPHENQNPRHPTSLHHRRYPPVWTEFTRCCHRHRNEHYPHKRCGERRSEHLTHAYPRLDTFCFRKWFPQQEYPINQGRNQNESDLALPACNPTLIESVCGQSTKNSSAGEPYMELIELYRFVIRIERSDKRITSSLDQTVGHCDH